MTRKQRAIIVRDCALGLLMRHGRWLAVRLIEDRGVVRAENLNRGVLVMQPANQGVRHDASDALNRASDRSMVRSRRIVITSVVASENSIHKIRGHRRIRTR